MNKGGHKEVMHACESDNSKSLVFETKRKMDVQKKKLKKVKVKKNEFKKKKIKKIKEEMQKE